MSRLGVGFRVLAAPVASAVLLNACGDGNANPPSAGTSSHVSTPASSAPAPSATAETTALQTAWQL